MSAFHKCAQNIKWYAVNIPVGCLTLFIILCIFLYSKSTLKFADEGVCLQPHFVMTGQVFRLLKYAVFHHDFKAFALSVLLLGIFGTVAERQMGSIRFMLTVTFLTVVTGLIITVASIFMAFTSQFASITYNCAGLGMSAPMFAILVLVCKNLMLKRVVCFFFTIHKLLLPWIVLAVVQLIFHETKLFSNVCGCIAGLLYSHLIRHSSLLSSAVIVVDDVFAKTMAYLPWPMYVRNTSAKMDWLPFNVHESGAAKHSAAPFHNHHHFHADGGAGSSSKPSANHVGAAAAPTDMVPQYKVSKMQAMGFERERSAVALAATGGSVEQAVALLGGDVIAAPVPGALMDAVKPGSD